MKIAVYAIALNENLFAERFMKACAEADLVIVADTGSTDGTPNILRKHGAIVHDIRITPWRFDDARNAALALVPADVDVCIALDLDEVPQAGWRETIERSWTDGTTQASFMLIYSHQPDGSPGTTFLNNRIHARRGYRWRHACHEAVYSERITELCITLSGLQVDHWPDPEKSRSSYLELLQAAVLEEPYSARMAHYLAREYSYGSRHEEALAEFERYLAFDSNRFEAERVGALVRMAGDAVALGRDPSSYFFRALAEAPETRDPWLGLAEHYYRQKNWLQCHAAAIRGLDIAITFTGYPTNPYYSGALGEDLASVAAWHLGYRREALDRARRAARQAPWDQRIMSNVYFMESEMKS